MHINPYLCRVIEVGFWPNPSPYDVKIDGICYKLVHKSGIARVVSGDVYYAGNVVIPQTIENEGIVYRVEEMADSAFCGCKNLTSVLIPNTITKIGKWMFDECSQLKSIALPEGLEKLSTRMFYQCSALDLVILPESVKTIEQEAFRGCTSLHSIILPESVELIDWAAFLGCTNLETVRLPSSLQHIYMETFAHCTNLRSIISCHCRKV